MTAVKAASNKTTIGADLTPRQWRAAKKIYRAVKARGNSMTQRTFSLSRVITSRSLNYRMILNADDDYIPWQTLRSLEKKGYVELNWVFWGGARMIENGIWVDRSGSSKNVDARATKAIVHESLLDAGRQMIQEHKWADLRGVMSKTALSPTERAAALESVLIDWIDDDERALAKRYIAQHNIMNSKSHKKVRALPP